MVLGVVSIIKLYVLFNVLKGDTNAQVIPVGHMTKRYE